jgi:signal transduction histidine kinase
VRLSAFIREHLDAIIDHWETFARTLVPPAKTMSITALRDHSREILLAIAHDMESAQTEDERSRKSLQLLQAPGAPETAAAAHGALRQLAGFDLMQSVAEFRAMRASVLSVWRRDQRADSECAIEEVIRFDAAVDQALAESVERYSSAVAISRDTFLAVLGHDLRNPLWVIQGSSEMLAKRVVPTASAGEAVLRIRSDCDLREVCEDALDTIQAIPPGPRIRAAHLRRPADPRRQGAPATGAVEPAEQCGPAR